jgi:hypothetical protein
VDEGIKARIARPWAFAIGGVFVLGVALVMVLEYATTTIDCTRTRGEEGACVVKQRKVFGTSERSLPASTIRGASINVSTSHRSGNTPAHTDSSLFIELTDGTSIQVDDASFGFLDSSFDADDARDIERFVADKTTLRTHAKDGGIASMLGIFVVLAGVTAFMLRIWGFLEVEIARRGDMLSVTGEMTSTHPLEGIANVGIDAAYRSLRVHYRDGSHQQSARLGVSVARLEDFARRTRALLKLT